MYSYFNIQEKNHSKFWTTEKRTKTSLKNCISNFTSATTQYELLTVIKILRKWNLTFTSLQFDAMRLTLQQDIHSWKLFDNRLANKSLSWGFVILSVIRYFLLNDDIKMLRLCSTISAGNEGLPQDGGDCRKGDTNSKHSLRNGMKLTVWFSQRQTPQILCMLPKYRMLTNLQNQNIFI